MVALITVYGALWRSWAGDGVSVHVSPVSSPRLSPTQCDAPSLKA
jgi:hypothetical protein